VGAKGLQRGDLFFFLWRYWGLNLEPCVSNALP
jgi:hypothetical protein